MNQGPVFSLLANFGLKKIDIYVYIFLAKQGPCKGKDMRNALGLPKQQLYLSLKNLQKKDIVSATSKRPALFSALSFEQVIALSVKSKINEAQIIQQHKQDLLTLWRSMGAQDTYIK